MTTDSFSWYERDDSTAIIRPTLDSVAVEPDFGTETWEFLIKPLASDGQGDDSNALLTISSADTGSTVLAVIDDPTSPGTDVIQVSVASADLPVPGSYRWVIRKTSPTRQTFDPGVVSVVDV